MHGRDTGFDNINMDLIAGLPREGMSDMKDTLADQFSCTGQSDRASTCNQACGQMGHERFTPGCGGDT